MSGESNVLILPTHRAPTPVDRVSHIETLFKITMTVGQRPVNNRASLEGIKDDARSNFDQRGIGYRSRQ
jgi:hypothetical protein